MDDAGRAEDGAPRIVRSVVSTSPGRSAGIVAARWSWMMNADPRRMRKASRTAGTGGNPRTSGRLYVQRLLLLAR